MAFIITPNSASGARRPAGALIQDSSQVADMLQCVHCNTQWQVVHGSGNKRGFCMNCMGVTCGSKRCCRCIPFEKKLEMRERFGKRIALK